ncbi:MAG: malonyl-CoA decarboxylase [Alphaproteobacteria bacterium]|jgi:malonyl-CoA decarboxylase|nr:malonyl-CoA decarboxylase [Alphaproteobacteria bacterium]MEA2989291.1 malonyl-CoA decarboxylase [Alphaproteobacteria bacterium]
MLQTIAERGRALLDRTRERRGNAQKRSADLVELSEQLLSGRGEASGVALAREILTRYAESTSGPRIAFFEALATGFGPDHARLDAAIAAWRRAPSDTAAAEVHAAAEPRRQELLRRLNLAPGGTVALVRMREQLLEAIDRRADLSVVDRDFVHMFSSWFNRGFLVLRRIDWSTPASVLEKIIRYEAVHQIRGWDDLRRRIDPPDRRCYAFFHPALVDDPLIFVEVALTKEIPAAIAPILTVQRDAIGPDRATTAVFYSISNCQRGLAGVSFGHFLIKQVAEEIAREYPKLSTFVTLSPAPNFAQWLDRERRAETSAVLSADDRAALANLDTPGWWQTEWTRTPVEEPLIRAAAWYFLHARTRSGNPVDAVARFHLGNGARLERLNWLADGSERAITQAHGLMVNYLYELDDIEKNHEAYAQQRTVVASKAVTSLARSPARDIVSAMGEISPVFL